MTISFDLDRSAATATARALFTGLDAGGSALLARLSGADLCVFGAQEHPLGWQALDAAWRKERLPETAGEQRKPRPRRYSVAARAESMLRDGLLRPGSGEPAGPVRPVGSAEAAVAGQRAGARYELSPELAVTIAARRHPVFVIRIQSTAEAVPLLLFGAGGQAVAGHGIVAAIPVPARGAAALAPADPLGTRFEHVLLAPRVATEFLTDRVLPLSPARHSHSHPHREITLVRAAGDPPRALAHLSVFTIGSVAHVKGEADGQPVFGDCDRAGLRTIMDYLARLGTR